MIITHATLTLHCLFPTQRVKGQFYFLSREEQFLKTSAPLLPMFLEKWKGCISFQLFSFHLQGISCPYRHVFFTQLTHSFNSLTKYRTLLLRPHPLLHSLFLLLHDLQKMSVGPNVCYFVEHNRLGNHLHPLCMTTTFILSKSMKYVHVFILRLPCSNFYRINCITNIFFLQHSMIPSSPYACSFQTTASKNHLYIHT